MGTNKFNPAIQIHQLKALVTTNVLTDYKQSKNVFGEYNFRFNLTNREIGGEYVNTNFSQYRIEIIYSPKKAPNIFIVNPILVPNAKHTFKDNSLCLYHWSNFSWDDSKSISNDLVPWIYLWIYFYEVWVKTGLWLAEEYKH